MRTVAKLLILPLFATRCEFDFFHDQFSVDTGTKRSSKKQGGALLDNYVLCHVCRFSLGDSEHHIADLFLSFLTEQTSVMKIYLSILFLAITLLGNVSGYKRRDHARGVKRPPRTHTGTVSRNLKTIQSQQAMHGDHGRGAPRNAGRHRHV